MENGPIDGPVTEKRLPKAGLSYFSTLVDMVTALEAGKVDAVVEDDVALILIALIDRLEIRVDPKRRKREDILKGVKTDD